MPCCEYDILVNKLITGISLHMMRPVFHGLTVLNENRMRVWNSEILREN